MTDLYGPNQRTDAAPLHHNAIRRFREELRMGRPEFAVLLDVKIDTLRVWEADKSKPRGEAAMKIMTIAERNDYPLSLTDLFGADYFEKLAEKEKKKKLAKKKAKKKAKKNKK